MVTEKPLVSIIVITYNSSRFVVETLESIKAQTYKNIELIISDDCSTDNTLEICKNWLFLNEQRFYRTNILVAKRNNGIPANCNQGIKVSKGEWIKLIAGDDKLIDSCIDDFISFILSNNNVYAIHARMNAYHDTFDEKNFFKTFDYSKDVYNEKNISAYEQYQLNLRRNWIGAPTVFLKRDLILELGGWDEEMPFEDWPMFIKINKSGYKIYYMNKTVVNYRIHTESLYNYNQNKLLFNDFFLKDRIIYQKYRRDYITPYERFIENVDYFRKKIFLFLGLNHDTLINRQINTFCNKSINYLKRVAINRIKRQIS